MLRLMFLSHLIWKCVSNRLKEVPHLAFVSVREKFSVLDAYRGELARIYQTPTDMSLFPAKGVNTN